MPSSNPASGGTTTSISGSFGSQGTVGQWNGMQLYSVPTNGACTPPTTTSSTNAAGTPAPRFRTFSASATSTFKIKGRDMVDMLSIDPTVAGPIPLQCRVTITNYSPTPQWVHWDGRFSVTSQSVTTANGNTPPLSEQLPRSFYPADCSYDESVTIATTLNAIQTAEQALAASTTASTTNGALGAPTMYNLATGSVVSSMQTSGPWTRVPANTMVQLTFTNTNFSVYSNAGDRQGQESCYGIIQTCDEVNPASSASPGSLRAFGTLDYLADSVITQVGDRTPARARATTIEQVEVLINNGQSF